MNPNQELWEKGDFTRIAESMRRSGDELVERIGVTEGLDVLDLGCGDGTTALPEARRGANVLGVDIARNLVEAGNKRAADAGLANLRFQQGDASSGEVPYTLSDGSHGVVLVRTMGGPKGMWFVSGATSDALEVAKVRHEPDDLVVDVHATVSGRLTWVGATAVEVEAGQTVGISRHDGPTVQSAYPIVIRLVDGSRTLGIVARLA